MNLSIKPRPATESSRRDLRQFAESFWAKLQIHREDTPLPPDALGIPFIEPPERSDRDELPDPDQD